MLLQLHFKPLLEVALCVDPDTAPLRALNPRVAVILGEVFFINYIANLANPENILPPSNSLISGTSLNRTFLIFATLLSVKLTSTTF